MQWTGYSRWERESRVVGRNSARRGVRRFDVRVRRSGGRLSRPSHAGARCDAADAVSSKQSRPRIAAAGAVSRLLLLLVAADRARERCETDETDETDECSATGRLAVNFQERVDCVASPPSERVRSAAQVGCPVQCIGGRERSKLQETDRQAQKFWPSSAGWVRMEELARERGTGRPKKSKGDPPVPAAQVRPK